MRFFPKPKGVDGGAAAGRRRARKETLDLRKRLDQLYAKHTGEKVRQVHDPGVGDRLYGLIDRVIEQRQLERRHTGFGSENGG